MLNIGDHGDRHISGVIDLAPCVSDAGQGLWRRPILGSRASGLANSVDVAPSATLQLANGLTLTIGAVGFWRDSTADGVYGIAIDLQRPALSVVEGPGQASTARHVGSQATAQLVWMLTSHVSISTTLSYFLAGRFLRDTPPGEDVQYSTAWITYRF